MNTPQLLKLLYTNRELIQKNNRDAIEHLEMLKNDYIHIMDEEIVLNLELNTSLAELHLHSHHENAMENSTRIISQFNNTKHKNLLARHYWLVGHCYANTGEYENAKKYLLHAMHSVTVDKPEFVTIKADVLVALAMNEELAGKDHQKAIEYLEQAIELLKVGSHVIYKASCLMGLGNVHINTNKTSQALQYYKEALEIYERHFDLANMASGYSNLGTCYINLEDYTLAERFLEKSLDMRLKFGTPQQLSISYYNLAIVYKNTGRKHLAYEALQKSKEILSRIDNKLFLNETEGLINELLTEPEAQQLWNY